MLGWVSGMKEEGARACDASAEPRAQPQFGRQPLGITHADFSAFSFFSFLSPLAGFSALSFFSFLSPFSFFLSLSAAAGNGRVGKMFG